MDQCFDARSKELEVKVTRMDLWVDALIQEVKTELGVKVTSLWVDALMPEVKSVLVVKVTRMDVWMGVAMLEVNN